jgi:hypothetical protein
MTHYHSLNITNESRHDTARLLEHTHTNLIIFLVSKRYDCLPRYNDLTRASPFEWFMVGWSFFPSANRYQQDFQEILLVLGMIPQCSEQRLSDHSLNAWGNHNILIKQ